MKGQETIHYQRCDCCLRRDVDHPEMEMVEEFYNVHICTDCSVKGWGICHKDDLRGNISKGEYARLSDMVSIRFDEHSNDFDYSEIKSIRHYVKQRR